MLKGGIVNKIASQFLDKNIALDGTSATVIKYGISSCFIEDRIYYWDDNLDDGQINILCRAYICETGKF